MMHGSGMNHGAMAAPAQAPADQAEAERNPHLH
jgi:hypothetical protein